MKITINRIVVATVLTAVLSLSAWSGHVEEQSRIAAETAAKVAERQNAIQAAMTPVMLKPWEKDVECGVLKLGYRECDRRYWPGQVYPDEPIPGEKTPGIVWQCSYQQFFDRTLPATKVCYADASPERKKRYPCPTYYSRQRRSDDVFCLKA